MLTRKKKLVLNTTTSLALQLVTLICGFILPRLILEAFGSEVNGLVNSIGQFLGVITLLDMGVGSVVQSSLYTPLSQKDDDTISKIYISAKKFFRRISVILLFYAVVLAVVYPIFVNKSFDYRYTSLLIGAICISNFAQYFFGMVNSLLLSADQKGFVQYIVQMITIIVNTAACAILIKSGSSIHVVKLTTSLIYLIRPFVLTVYVKKYYNINSKIEYTDEPLKQKWNGMAQHLAAYVLGGTDNIVLTMFSSLTNVSIYGVYNLVITGVKNLFLSLTHGFQALIGEMIAKKENVKLNRFFGYVEWILHTGITLIFGCTGILIVPFVKVYTNGIGDAEYIQPLFAVLLTLAHAAHSLRLPYNMIILAAGHYKQTQGNYIVAMFMNIVISVMTVKYFGLIGVAIGTLIAMIYQTVWMAWYDSKNIIYWPMKKFFKQISIDILTVLIASFLTFRVPLISVSYFAWIIKAIIVFVIWLSVVIIINLVFYRDMMYSLTLKIRKK